MSPACAALSRMMTPFRFSSQISPFALAVMARAARALNPGAGELGNVAELVHFARGLQRGDRAKAYQRADERERIGSAPEVKRAATHAGRGDKDLRHRHRARRPEASNACLGRDPGRRNFAPCEGQKSQDRQNGRDCWRANEFDAEPHGFPLVEPTPPAPQARLANLSTGCQQSLGSTTFKGLDGLNDVHSK